eukprot:3432467-Ditylum_brightwellii.AAC.1
MQGSDATEGNIKNNVEEDTAVSKVQESEQEVSRDGKTMENVNEDEAGFKMQRSNKDVASPLEGSDEVVIEVNQEDSTE